MDWMNTNYKPFSIQRYFSVRERYGMEKISRRRNSKREIRHYSMIQDTRISKASRGQDGWDPTLWRNAMTMVQFLSEPLMMKPSPCFSMDIG